MNPRIFRENDIRGHADRELDDRTVTALGAVLGRRAAAHGADERLVVGRDGRLHSPRLFAALIRGAAPHCSIVDLGVVPTPVVSFAARHLAREGRAAVAVAVMITGSHNPADENGFKISLSGASLHDAEVAALRDEVAAELERTGSPAAPLPDGAAAALAATAAAPLALDLGPAYLDNVVRSLRLGPRRFSVALDAGNGAAGPLALALLARLGFAAAPLYCDIDGRFPHHHPDPTVEQNLADLRALVAERGAELGVGLDGDGDRLGVVDERGRVVWGDQLLILLGRALLAEIPGAGITAEVKCSQSTFDCLAAAGAKVEMWQVGHSRLKARMRETGALLAGEMSGHFFFADRYLGFDDGLYATARLLELLSRQDRSLAALVDELPHTFATPEARVPCPDERKATVVAEVTARLRAHPQVGALVELDGVRATFAGGWTLLRASTTQPALTLRAEADSPERLAELVALLHAELAACLPPA